MTLVNPDSFSIRSPSPPHAQASEDVPGGLLGEEEAAVRRTTGAADKTFREDAVAASQLVNQSNSKGAEPGRSPADKVVQLCPHEELDFDRVQRILELKGFKYKKGGIDALRDKEISQHEKSRSWSTSLICHPNNNPPSEPSGDFRLIYHSKYRIGSKSIRGLALHVTWTLSFHPTGAAEEIIQESLNKLVINLCPHKKINDLWVASKIHMIANPPEPSSDPIDLWGKKPKSTSIRISTKHEQDCVDCGAHIKVSGVNGCRPEIEVTRILGECISENDPAWLAQCSCLGEERSDQDVQYLSR